MSVHSSDWNLYCTSVDAESIYNWLVAKGKIFGAAAEFRVEGNCVYWRHVVKKKMSVRTLSGAYRLDKKPGSLSAVEERQSGRFRIKKYLKETS